MIDVTLTAYPVHVYDSMREENDVSAHSEALVLHNLLRREAMHGRKDLSPFHCRLQHGLCGATEPPKVSLSLML